MINGWLKLAVGCLVVAGSAFLAGCDSSGGAHDVTGTVTFEGEPVKQGQIAFESGTIIGAQITDGKFTAQLPPGKYKVRITATREEGVAPDGLPNYVSYIPKKYNEQTTLEEDVSGKKEVKYELTK